MSARKLMVVEQPCILCEAPLQVWTLLVDEETGAEHYEIEDCGHVCPDLKALMREYGRP